MLGYKPKVFKSHIEISVEDLVPRDNFYRHVEAVLDLSFVRDLVRDCYSPSMGRPSIDPVVFFKLQLIMFFEGIRSERQLMEMVSLNLAHRWYIGYDLDEEVPNHSSLTKIRRRYGLETFQRFFEHVVALCIEAGLVWGKELYVDATKVQANASIRGMVPRFYHEAKQHLQELFGEEEVAEETADAQPELALAGEIPITSRSLVGQYDGTRITSRDNHWYERQADVWVSPTDPDATPMQRSKDGRSGLGYRTHYVVDGGKARIILAALVTPASIMDNTPMLDLIRWARFRWHLKPKIGVGDAKYGTIANIAGLEQDGIMAYMPRTDRSTRKLYSPARFHYDAEKDCYICPQGEVLTFKRNRYTEGTVVYQAGAAVCNACPMKSKCTNSKNGRQIHRSILQEYLDRAEEHRRTEAYHKAMEKRKLWPEPLFGEAKMWHGLDRFRLRRLGKVNIEGLMIATGQNLKRLLTYKGWGKRRGPAGWGAALALEPSFSFS